MGKARNFQSRTGLGISAQVEDRYILVGNDRLLEESGIPRAGLEQKAEELRRQGQTVVFVGVDSQAAGLIGIADPIKASAAQAVRDLRREGIRLVMLSGDNRVSAETVARELGIDEFEAEVLPERKSEIVRHGARIDVRH